MSTQIEELKFQFELLRSRLEQVEQAQGEKAPAKSSELELVENMTREVFGAPVTLKLKRDQDCDEYFVVVEVPAHGTDAEIDQRTQTWHRFLAERLPADSTYCLSLQFAR